MRARGLLGAALGVTLLAAGDAGAYVRSRSNACNPIYWPQQCVYVTLDKSGALGNGNQDLSFDDVVTGTKNAIDSWQSRLAAAGSYLQLKYYPADQNRETELDYIPVIKFRYDTCSGSCNSGQWCRPARGTAKVQCYDRSAAALTTVFFYDTPNDRARDGQIIDADIELNAVHNHFYNKGMNPKPADVQRSGADLWNTLTHELGHLVGLEHTCLASPGETTACTVDQNGGRAPLCGQVLANTADPVNKALSETTMFATADVDETKKRVPKADDLAGVTAAYPSAVLALLGNPRDPYACKAPQERDLKQPPFGAAATGCGAGLSLPPPRGPGAGSGAALWLGALCAAVTLISLRRQRALARS